MVLVGRWTQDRKGQSFYAWLEKSRTFLTHLAGLSNQIETTSKKPQAKNKPTQQPLGARGTGIRWG